MLKRQTALTLSLLAVGVLVTSLACHTDAPTPATHGAPRKRSPTASADTDAYPVIVRVVGRHQAITVTAGPKCPLYSASTTDGKLLVANATLDQLRNEHPDLYQQLDPTLALEPENNGAARQAAETSKPADASVPVLLMGSAE
jgi:hypothetical protein